MRSPCFLAAVLLFPAVGAADDKQTPAEYAAKVIEKVNKAKSVKIVLKFGEDAKDPKTAEGWVYFFRRDLGIRMDLRDPKTGDAAKIAIASPKAEKWIMLDVKEKTATARRFTETQFEKEGKELVPIRLEVPTDITAGDDEKIGGRTTKVIEGVTKGLGARAWTLWVDPKTDLPVRVRVEKPGPNDKLVTMEFTYDDWDKEFDAKLFAVELPEGYKFAPAEKK